MLSLQERIEKTFSADYAHLLLDDVGFVKFHRCGSSKKENWGIIESHNGDVLFFTSAVRTFFINRKGDLKIIPIDTPVQLQGGQAVTFRSRAQEDGRLRAPIVVAWDEEAFAKLGPEPEFRFLETRAVAGGLGSTESETSERTLWRGTCLDHLRRNYPRERFPVRDGSVKTRRFEQFDASKRLWKGVEDPR